MQFRSNLREDGFVCHPPLAVTHGDRIPVERGYGCLVGTLFFVVVPIASPRIKKQNQSVGILQIIETLLLAGKEFVAEDLLGLMPIFGLLKCG